MPHLYPAFQLRSKNIIEGLVAWKTKAREEWNFWPMIEDVIWFRESVEKIIVALF
jgi:hypothetical protein